ncbi:glycosyltransferase family 1 protein [Mucilaginibacter sp. CSA2-8R]|uniref:glycosyltransferase family 4 protein n=1 Tax=Mucilaginibacter sp. CSA2-8R TaxID=3141542 RepID=UPI00315D4354
MHIVIDARMLQSSGIGTYLQNIIEGLRYSGYEITLLGDIEQLYRFSNFARIIEFTDPIYSIKEQLKYSKVIPQCDVFWSPHYNIPLSRSVKAKRRIVTIHDAYHLAFYDSLPLKQKLYAKFVLNKAVTMSDSIITVSNFSRNEILKFTGCKPDKISVIYNGVNKPGLEDDNSVLKSKYQLPDNYILFVGNVKPHKNLSTLLKAYSALDKSIKLKYKLVIAGKKDGFITGDSEIFTSLNNDSSLKESVCFTGYIDPDDMNSLYKHASLFVFPSSYEGFGLPPLEAMANSCPVIVASSSCLPEICGDAVNYFPYNDTNALKVLIKNVLTSSKLRGELINKGKKRVLLFPWSSSIDCHKKTFETN